MSLMRKHGAVLQAWACLDLVYIDIVYIAIFDSLYLQREISAVKNHFTEPQRQMHRNAVVGRC